MSDMYLVLRSRLETMRQWVQVGTDILFEARTAKGLSYEAVARQIPCSAKTYERYEKAGRVPLDLVDRIAEVLGIEIERPTFDGKITVDRRSETERLAGAAAEIAVAASSIQKSAARIEARLDELDRPRVGRPRR